MYFKIKTTAPKKYCVRPNSGALKPKGVTEIAGILSRYHFSLVIRSNESAVVHPDYKFVIVFFFFFIFLP